MILVLAFVAAWMLQHTWTGKVSDFQGNRDQVRQQINKAHPNWDAERREKAVHRATRRSAVGWLAYQFRHGWSPMVGDVVDGYRAARIGHAEWLTQRPEEPEGGWWQRAKASTKAGWEGAKTKAKAVVTAAPKPTPSADPLPAAPDAGGAPSGPDDRSHLPPYAIPLAERLHLDQLKEQEDAQKREEAEYQELVNARRAEAERPPKLRAVPTPTEGNNDMSTSEEVRGYAGARQLTSGYQNSLNAAADQLEQYEADLLAGGLGNDPGVIDSLAAAKEALQNAQAAFEAHASALAGHEQGAEYAADKGAAAANTQWLGNGA